MVRHLVVCGTPNGGSPWSTVGDLATSTMASGAERRAALSGPLAVVGTALSFVVQAVERVDVTLDSMSPGSDAADCARRLALSRRFLMRRSRATTRSDRPPRPAEPGSSSRRYAYPELVLDAVFTGTANDLAVSVSSATTFGSSWAARPPQIEVDCNHLTYFASADGMAAVRRALSWPDS